MIGEQGPSRPLHSDETPTEVMQAVGAEQAKLPRLPQHALPVRTRERRQLKLTAALAVLILAVLGVAGYEVASGLGSKPHVSAAPVTSQSVTSHPVAAPSPVASSPSPIPTPSLPSATPSKSASSVSVVARVLKPAGATSVDPGSAAGDNPSSADLAVDGSMSTAWQTQWYATPEFGGLKTGAGLLIDMGRVATITSVRVTLGSEAGTDLQLRVGDSSSVSSLRTMGAKAGVGGTVRFKFTSPRRARYVLIWITKLPPDGAGTYQIKVYNISVSGQP